LSNRYEDKGCGRHLPKELRVFPLLTREGEIRIAKKIKTGRQEILSAALNYPTVIQEIINLGKDLRSGKMELKELNSELTVKRSPFKT